MARRSMVAGNWKSNGSQQSNQQLLVELSELDQSALRCTVVICPPSIYLSTAKEQLPSAVKLGAQNVSAFEQGAYTGEVSADMLRDTGCDYAIVGHSERRQLFNEQDADVATKALRLLEHSITPIVCVGETLSERQQGDSIAVVLAQLNALLNTLNSEQLAQIVVAYEPIWAIGTGETASPEQAQAVHASIREWFRKQVGAAADQITILYGGSVKSSNATELFAQADIDGGLIGGASLNAQEFYKICNAAG